MNQMLRIRKEILTLTQAEMAELSGVRQATVSRWERGELEPGREEMKRIRNEALRRGIEWDDKWFFEPPDAPFAPPATGARAAL